MTVDEWVDQVVAEAPSWDELPVETRTKLLRLFRPQHLVLPATGSERSA